MAPADGTLPAQGFEYRIEVRRGYVFVWQQGKASTPIEVSAMTTLIDDALHEAGTRFVMFDNRETTRPDEYARAMMWSWLTQNVDRAALLQKEARNIKRAEARGEQNRVAVRAFHDEAEAEVWLLAARPGG